MIMVSIGIKFKHITQYNPIGCICNKDNKDQLIITLMYSYFLQIDLYYSGESSTDLAHSLTCPICGRLGFTESELQSHVTSEHQNSNTEVVSKTTFVNNRLYN